MQGFILTAAEKYSLVLDLRLILTMSLERENVGKRHRVMVSAQRVCQGQLLRKVSYSHLSLLQRNAFNSRQHKF